MAWCGVFRDLALSSSAKNSIRESHQYEAGTDVVNAKSGKGSATLSMAYAGPA